MLCTSVCFVCVGLSLSARRAWIEISRYPPSMVSPSVALRKESVDRNHAAGKSGFYGFVALRKESVDRNVLHLGRDAGGACRSPQGERG